MFAVVSKAAAPAAATNKGDNARVETNTSPASHRAPLKINVLPALSYLSDCDSDSRLSSGAM